MIRAGVLAWATVAAAALGASVARPVSGGAQKPAACEDESDWGDRGHFCEVREVMLPVRDEVSVDGGTNGGVSVEGWQEARIKVEAKVQAWARTDAAAADLARRVVVRTDGSIRADGPEDSSWRHEGWAVSYHLYVPRRTDLELRTHNGGVSVEGVAGTMRFEALNGGLHLTDVAGDVRGRTTNGGVHVDLSGDRWNGEGLDVRTTNGGVRLRVPEGYNAHLETGTVNGGMDIGFPVTVQGRIRRSLSTDLGRGGAPIRVTTTNGGVRIGHS